MRVLPGFGDRVGLNVGVHRRLFRGIGAFRRFLGGLRQLALATLEVGDVVAGVLFDLFRCPRALLGFRHRFGVRDVSNARLVIRLVFVNGSGRRRPLRQLLVLLGDVGAGVILLRLRGLGSGHDGGRRGLLLRAAALLLLGAGSVVGLLRLLRRGCGLVLLVFEREDRLLQILWEVAIFERGRDAVRDGDGLVFGEVFDEIELLRQLLVHGDDVSAKKLRLGLRAREDLALLHGEGPRLAHGLVRGGVDHDDHAALARVDVDSDFDELLFLARSEKLAQIALFRFEAFDARADRLIDAALQIGEHVDAILDRVLPLTDLGAVVIVRRALQAPVRPLQEGSVFGGLVGLGISHASGSP